LYTEQEMMQPPSEKMLFLPWPPRELSPNARVHRLAKAKIAKRYRAECYLLAKATGIKLSQKSHITVIFFPPDLRRRDLDNCLASIKSGLDGVADAWGINDRDFRPITIDFGEVGEKVLVKLDR